ncbi:MAG TPA: NRDE family protein [Gemmataceae bacterium]
MCLLAILFRAVHDAPVVIGANREESYARGGTEPDVRRGPVPFIAGLDPLAGGTWLGVNARGVVAAVTNRPRRFPPESPRSRGLLVRDLLAAGSAKEALEMATRELTAAAYAGCNLLVADARDACVVHAGDWLRVALLPPGAHVLTNGDVNQTSDPRVRFALDRLRPRRFEDAEDAVATLRRICAHSGPPAPICLHGPESGTVSSTLIALREPPAAGLLYHANGPPDRTPYQDRSDLFRKLAQAARPGGE